MLRRAEQNYLHKKAEVALDLIRHQDEDLELKVLQFEVAIGEIPHSMAAPRFRELLGRNEEWADLLARYGGSPSTFSRLLVELYRDRFIAYSDIYRMARSLNIGDSTIQPQVVGRPRIYDYPSIASELSKRVALIDIVSDYEITKRIKQFSLNPDVALEDIERDLEIESNILQRQIYENVRSQLRRMMDLRVSAIRDEYQPRRYQAAAILRGIGSSIPERSRIGIFNDMRTGKTLIGLCRMEVLGVTKTLIVCPAGLKDTWQRRISREYYKEDPGSVIIEGARLNRELAKVDSGEVKFAIVGYDLLPEWGSNRLNRSLIEELSSIGFPGMIFDESQYAKNYYAGIGRAEAVLTLSRMASLRHLALLSGTPIDNPRDIEIIACLLDPENYTDPKKIWNETNGKPNPRIAGNLLLPWIVRMSAKEVLNLPEVTEKTDVVKLTPSQKALYDFVLDDESLHPFTKLTMLQAAILQPRLVKGLKVEFSEERAYRLLEGAYIKWRRQVSSNPKLKFDTDFLVLSGYKDLYIGAHFNLAGGVHELVRKSGAELIVNAWNGESVPAKFQRIAELIRERLRDGKKVIVYTSYFTTGITRDREDEYIEQEHARSLLAYLKSLFGDEAVMKIDGEDRTESEIVGSDGQVVSERELLRRRWQDDSSVKILLCNKASSLGIDLSIADPSVKGVTVIMEGLPLSMPQFKQAKARVLDENQLSPVEFIYLEAEDTIDEDKVVLLDAKIEVEGMFIDGVLPTERELETIFSDVKNKNGFLSRMLKSPRENVTLIFNSMMRQSVEENREFLGTQFTPSQTYGEYLAKHYGEVSDRGYAQYVSQVVGRSVSGLEELLSKTNLKVADFGSGPLVLASTLGRPVYSVDLSEDMLNEGLKRLKELGVDMPDEYAKVASITDLPKDVFADDCMDIGVCSLSIDCVSPIEERLKALKEIQRVISPGGYIVLTVPEAEMSSVEFNNFRLGMDRLGFRDDRAMSGFIKGFSDDVGVFNCWLLVMRKDEVSRGVVSPELFRLSFEKARSTRVIKEEKKVRNMIRQRAEKMTEVDTFKIYLPLKGKGIDKWPERGDLENLLGYTPKNQVLAYLEEELNDLGLKREIVVERGVERVILTNR